MKDGVIEQQGSPIELYDAPVNRFVAGFIGSPAMNFVPAIVGDDGLHLSLQFGAGLAAGNLRLNQPLKPGSRILAGIRPEHIQLTEAGKGQFSLPVAVVETTGSATFITTATTPEISMVVQGRSNVISGEQVGFAVDPAFVHLFDENTGRRI
jgi:multiple sugar transport system ATP-binding protein